MYELKGIIPDQEVLLALEPAEVGEAILKVLLARTASNPFSLHNEMIWLESGNNVDVYPNTRAAPASCGRRVQLAFGERTFSPDSRQSREGLIISRRGREMKDPAAFADFKTARLLPVELIHASIRDQTWRAFLRGEYDNAVLQAMKAVEIAVREFSGLGRDLVGVKLARKAFQPDSGPLTDPDIEQGEQQARADLFAGALGSYKNPQSHRHVALEDPAEAIEQLVVASHLLRIVDGCRTRRQF